MHRPHDVIGFKKTGKVADKRYRSAAGFGFEADIELNALNVLLLETSTGSDVALEPAIELPALSRLDFLGVAKPVVNRRDMLGDADPVEAPFEIGDNNLFQRIGGMATEFAAVAAMDGYPLH